MSITLEQIVDSYKKEYIPVTAKRSFPMNSTGPETVNKILQAVTLLAYDSPVGVDKVYTKAVSKVTASTHEVLTRMTAEPFPLLESKKTNPGSGLDEPVPLYDASAKRSASSKYCSVQLSELGKLATRHYKDRDLYGFTQHKSIVPISLLRSSFSMTLAYSTKFLPLNPEELFKLMILYIEKEIDDDEKDITLEEFCAVFKGVDVGDNYRVFISNQNLVSLYKAGISSVNIAPVITISREDRTIKFARPPYQKSVEELRRYFASRLKDKNYYKSFTHCIDMTDIGPTIILKNVVFNGTNAQIITELLDDIFINTPFLIQHSILIPKDDFKEENIIDNDKEFAIEVRGVKKTLQKNIEWEVARQKETILKEIEALKESITENRLLEKFTRPWVLSEILKFQRDNDREEKTYKLLGHPEHKLKKEDGSEDEGFTKQEIELIWSRKNNNILSKTTPKDREKILREIQPMLNQLEALEALVKDDNGIKQKIKNELIQMISGKNALKYKRKSEVIFISKRGKTSVELEKDALNYKSAWEDEDLPCYINIYTDKLKNIEGETILYRTYGVNDYTIDKKLSYRIATTNKSWMVKLESSRNNKISTVKFQPADIITGIKMVETINQNLIGILPLPEKDEKVYYLTNHSRLGCMSGNSIVNGETIKNEFISSFLEKCDYVLMVFDKGALKLKYDKFETLVGLKDGGIKTYIDEILGRLRLISKTNPDDNLPMWINNNFSVEVDGLGNMENPKLVPLDLGEEGLYVDTNNFDFFSERTYLPISSIPWRFKNIPFKSKFRKLSIPEDILDEKDGNRRYHNKLRELEEKQVNGTYIKITLDTKSYLNWNSSVISNKKLLDKRLRN